MTIRPSARLNTVSPHCRKLAKHAPGKKSAAGDKAPIVKASARTVMDYFGLPFIDRPVTTNE